MVSADNTSFSTIESTPTLPTITIISQPIASLTKTEIIDQEFIRKLPNSNGSLTEILKIVPGVQFSEDFENSKTGGEIKPPEVSISGGRPEDNNYILDGTGNNSLLDPAYKNIHNTDNIPGYSQELFIFDHLIDNIKVLRANIPARYGGFTGGVIKAKTIDPASEFGGRVSYRMTNSAWGKFHIDPDDKEAFYNSTDADNQPDFIKYQFSTTLSVPLNEKMSLLFDYSKLQSKIPLRLFGKEKTQYRKNENIFLKFIATPHLKTKLSFSAMYAPYEKKYYLKDTLNSDYTLIGGGYRLNGQLNQETDIGNIEFNLNFQNSENSRKAPADWYSWRTTPNKDWGSLIGSKISKEGGHGDIEKQQKSLTTNIHFESIPITKKTLTHQINTGLELSYTKATFDRTETSVGNIATLADGSIKKIKANGSIIYYPIVSCSVNDLECIEGEQYIFYRNVSPTDNATAQILNLSSYIEDTIQKELLTLRPGIRISYNNYQENTDLAPRLSASFDLWRNNKTILSTGTGRYYNTNLLTLKLEEQKKPYEVYRRSTVLIDNKPELWPETPRKLRIISASRVSDLKTPYSDEWTVGLQQVIWNGQFEAIYINREYKDQIISVVLDQNKDDPYKYKEWRNLGRRKHEELSLNYQKSGDTHFLSFNITWSKTKSNSSTYADSYREHQLEDKPDQIDYVWYNDKLMLRKKLPPNNFNRPIKASLIYIANLPYGLSFSNTTNYRGRYKTLIVDGKDPSRLYDAYVVSSVPSSLIFDWKISWVSPEWKGNSLRCTLDILNVFDRKSHYGPKDNNYLLGRQFWAGLEFNF